MEGIYDGELNLRQMCFITNYGNKHGPYGSNNEYPADKFSVSIVNQNVLDQATDYALRGSDHYGMDNQCTQPEKITAFSFYVSLSLPFEKFKF